MERRHALLNTIFLHGLGAVIVQQCTQAALLSHSWLQTLALAHSKCSSYGTLAHCKHNCST